jgi:hypothetical protein
MIQKDFASLTPKKLWSDDGAEKVLAIIELLTNPDKYQNQLENIRGLIQTNEELVQDYGNASDIEALKVRAESALEVAASKAEQATVLLDESTQRAGVIVDEAGEKATKIKNAAQRYVEKHKEGAREVEILEKQLKALITKNEKVQKQITAERTKLVAERKKFQERYAELQKRFAEV